MTHFLQKPPEAPRDRVAANQELAQLLAELFTDAAMALNGDWDRSDAGFECQMENIEAFYTTFFGADIRVHPVYLCYCQECG